MSPFNRTAFYPQTISVFNIVIFGLAALSRLYDDEPEKMVAGLAGIFVNVVLLCGVKVGKLSLYDKKIGGTAKPCVSQGAEGSQVFHNRRQLGFNSIYTLNFGCKTGGQTRPNSVHQVKTCFKTPNMTFTRFWEDSAGPTKMSIELHPRATERRVGEPLRASNFRNNSSTSFSSNRVIKWRKHDTWTPL